MRARLADPAFDELAPQIAALVNAAWDGYAHSRKSPHAIDRQNVTTRIYASGDHQFWREHLPAQAKGILQVPPAASLARPANFVTQPPETNRRQQPDQRSQRK
jgi:hypothetical protein